MKTLLIPNFSSIFNGIGVIEDIIIIILTVLVCTFLIIYFSFLLISVITLIFLKSDAKKISINPSVSVIVAVRNGEKSVNRLIDCFLNQKYSGTVEFILIDDESTDNTKNIIQDIAKKDKRFIYVSSVCGSKKLNHKKRALDAGIKMSKNSILLFTDVDCIISNDWVGSMANSFNDNTDYVIGFSRAKLEYGFANLFQRVDFLILFFSGVAATQIKYPLASSGQNQAYKRTLFDKVGGYNKISNLLMGDDSIFMQLCLRHNINVKFCLNQDSFVYCRPEQTWKSLLLQRARWAGDGKIMWKFNFPFYLIMVSTVVINLIIILFLFFDIAYLLPIVFMKFILEAMLAYIGSSRLNQNISISDFIFWFILNIPYVCAMCIASFFVGFISWKNRDTQ